MVQTDEREIATQTEPFSPEVLPESRSHELMRLKDFKWGERLPATIEDLFYFEELLEKEAFEDSLPPLTDENSFGLRRRLMEDQETKEWSHKEEMLKKKQAGKLHLLQNVLIERERIVEEENYAKIELLKTRKADEKNELVAKIQKRKAKTLRKIFREDRKFTHPGNERDIANEYQDFASRVYARFDRDGQPRVAAEGADYLKDRDVFAVKDWMDPKELSVRIAQDELEAAARRKYLKLEKQHLLQLERAKSNLLHKKDLVDPSENIKLLDNIQNIQPRPGTPFYQAIPALAKYKNLESKVDEKYLDELEKEIAKEEEMNVVAFLLQRLLRGRALQNLMFDGKEKRLALIEELLIVANVHEVDKNEEALRIERERKEQKEAAIVFGAQGEVISATLDELALEKGRQEIREDLAKQVKMAEGERSKREAEEAGRRQAEGVLKEREERLFKEVSEMVREQADEVLEGVFEFSSAFLAKKEAVSLTSIKERKFLKYVSMNEHNHEVLIKDLMYCFLLPNVNKEKLQEQVRKEEKTLYSILKEKDKSAF